MNDLPPSRFRSSGLWTRPRAHCLRRSCLLASGRDRNDKGDASESLIATVPNSRDHRVRLGLSRRRIVENVAALENASSYPPLRATVDPPLRASKSVPSLRASLPFPEGFCPLP
eukprot:Amastigsp_a508867_92.p5 type:complete len:114 gc:universal Amastigsp_a508867_92:1029-1370(+)